MKFEGKVVLITGAASGMGRLAARRMADAGARVMAVDVNAAGLHATAEGRERIRVKTLDVTDHRAVAEVVHTTERELGPIDRVYNAAAIMPTDRLLDQDLDTVHRIMDINYNGVANISLTVLPGMVKRGSGELINFASMAGWIPLMHFGAYNASKFAVVAFTEVLHHETRKTGVKVVCVCPPAVDTPLLEQAKSKPKTLAQLPPIKPEEVLDAIEPVLEADKLWVFPGRTTSMGWRFRRFLPDVLWKNVHKTEGF